MTYGDLAPKLSQWAMRHLLELQGIDRTSRFLGLKKENDPMNISIHLREITNGVLVSAGDLSIAEVQYFPSWEIAMSELPGVAAVALERDRNRFGERVSRTAGTFVSGTFTVPESVLAAVSQPVEEAERGLVDGPDGPEFVGQSEPDRLPEEEAALNQPAFVIGETDASYRDYEDPS